VRLLGIGLPLTIGVLPGVSLVEALVLSIMLAPQRSARRS
jgi:hypothetical protein